jgi:hypothetical protein
MPAYAETPAVDGGVWAIMCDARKNVWAVLAGQSQCAAADSLSSFVLFCVCKECVVCVLSGVCVWWDSSRDVPVLISGVAPNFCTT